MDSGEWSAIGGVASAAIAVVSTAVAVWQARIARRAARAADRSLAASLDQAHSARESAESAWKSAQASITQAIAATEQVELMREQQAAEVSERDRREQPEFTLRVTPDSTIGMITRDANGATHFTRLPRKAGIPVQDWYRLHAIELELVNGAGTYTVEVSSPRHHATGIWITAGGPFRMTQGSVEKVNLIAPYGASGTSAEVAITSNEIGAPGRHWAKPVSFSIP